MNMVAHQAIRIYLAAKLLLKENHIHKVIGKIIIGGKDNLTVMSALHHMMRGVGKYYSCLTWHTLLILLNRSEGQ
jgi:hypothetical protein